MGVAEDGLDETVAEDVEMVRSGNLADEVVESARLLDRLEVEWLRRVGELDRRG